MEYWAGNTYGTLDSAPDGKIIERVFNYVTSILLEFKGKYDENENAITNRLCKTLDFKKPPEYPFFFHHQNIEDETENTSTDFAVFGTYAYAIQNNLESDNIPLVKFEAKRLSSELPQNREREYVIGEYDNGKQIRNSGGLERFKNLRHGKDVDHAGMIAYVQTGSFDIWVTKINNWIQNEIKNPHDPLLIWDSDDLLQSKLSKLNLRSFLSYPKRKIRRQLMMHHFWIKFN